MDLNSLAVFNMANRNLSYLSERHKVLAENVANATTPRYLARDVERPNFAEELKASTARLATTDPKHFAAPPAQSASSFKTITPKPKQALTIDGNGVDIEAQMHEMSKNSGEQNNVLGLYNKYRSLLKLANTNNS